MNSVAKNIERIRLTPQAQLGDCNPPYRVQLSPRMSLQPDIQYIATPSGIYRDALVVGTRMQIAWQATSKPAMHRETTLKLPIQTLGLESDSQKKRGPFVSDTFSRTCILGDRSDFVQLI
jgi:hypothetical protein